MKRGSAIRLALAATPVCLWDPPRRRRSIRSTRRKSSRARASISRSSSPARPRSRPMRVTINGQPERTPCGKESAAFAEREDERPFALLDSRRDDRPSPAPTRSKQPSATRTTASAGKSTPQRPAEGEERDPVRRRRPLRSRTAPRRASCPRASSKANTAASSPWTTMDHMALVSTSGTDSVVTDSRQRDVGLYHRPQDLRQCARHLLRAQQELARSSEGRDHRRIRQAHARHVRRRDHQHGDRRRDARRAWSPTPAAAPTTTTSSRMFFETCSRTSSWAAAR